MSMWMHEKADRKPETEIERLDREADELDRQADHMKGCTWMGDEPPWSHLQRSAMDKRMLASLLRLQAKRPAAGGDKDSND